MVFRFDHQGVRFDRDGLAAPVALLVRSAAGEIVIEGRGAVAAQSETVVGARSPLNLDQGVARNVGQR